MSTLDEGQLIDLEEGIIDNLWSLLTRRNAEGTLDRLLRDMDLYDELVDLLGIPKPLDTWKDGKILVVGDAQCRPKDLVGVAKSMGISSERMVFVDVDEATNYDFAQLEYSPRWCAVLFGATPHSTKGKGEDSSTITHMENNRDRYPEVRRLHANSRLKITKTNFRNELNSLMDAGLLEAG